jgi:hypothetical protein
MDVDSKPGGAKVKPEPGMSREQDKRAGTVHSSERCERACVEGRACCPRCAPRCALR